MIRVREILSVVDMKRVGKIDADPKAVQAALEHLLASKTFARSAQLRRFLELTVRKTLEGRSEDIKETTIAVEAYRRPASYDPRLDAIVRTEAQRLRKKLAAHYDTEGRDEPLRIEYRKGTYVPTFSSASAHSSPERNAPPWRRALAIAAIVAASVIATLLWQRTFLGPVPRVAVLPFDDFSPGGEHAALAMAASESIMTELARQPGLEVVSRSASMRLQDPIMPIEEYVASLSADYIIGGSFQRSGDRCRVSARLIRTEDDANVWAEQYSFDWSQVFQVQAEIAEDVAAEIGAFIAPRNNPSESNAPPEAYEALARGRYAVYQYVNTKFPEYVAQAERELKRALELAPDYGDALAELASLKMNQIYPPHAESGRLLLESREILTQALRIDPQHTQSLFLLAQVEAQRGDERQALTLTQRGLDLDPEGPDGYHYAATLYSRLGFYEAAVVASERAIALRTLSARPYRQKVLALIQLKRLAEAEASLSLLRELSVPGPQLALFEAKVHVHAGELEAADATLVSATAAYSGFADTSALEILHGLVAALAGDLVEARHVLEKYRDSRRFLDDLANLALVLGETRVALDHIAQTPMTRNYRWLVTNPHARAYLAEPEFSTLAEELYGKWQRNLEIAGDSLPALPPSLPAKDEVPTPLLTKR